MIDLDLMTFRNIKPGQYKKIGDLVWSHCKNEVLGLVNVEQLMYHG